MSHSKSPIQIDLRNLTQAHVDRIDFDSRDACKYAAPCIIGAMIDDPNARDCLDGLECDADVGSLMQNGYLSAPQNQIGALVKLQEMFDCSKNHDETDVRQYIDELRKHYNDHT